MGVRALEMHRGEQQVTDAAVGDGQGLPSEILEAAHRTGQELLDAFAGICAENGLRYYLAYGTLLGAVRHKGPIPWDDDVDVAMPREDYERFRAMMLARLEGESYHIQCFENERNIPFYFMRFCKRGTTYILRGHADIDLNCREFWLDIFPLDESMAPSERRTHADGRKMELARRILYNKVRTNMQGRSLRARAMHMLLRGASVDRIHSYAQRIMWRNRGKQLAYYTDHTVHYEAGKVVFPKQWFDPPVKLEYNGKLYDAPREWDKVLTQIYNNYMIPPPPDERKGHAPVEARF